MSTHRPLALTMGDPAGIGPEIVTQVFRLRPDWSRDCVVVGELATLRRAAAATGGLLPVAVVERPADVATLPPGCLPLWPTAALPAPVPWGQVGALAGRAAADAIERAAQAALRGDVAALVTAPIHKEALAAAGVDHPGHTEYLQALAAAHLGRTPAELPVRMMLSNDELRTVLVSIHVSLREAIERVTPARVLETLQITDRHFRQRGAGRRCRIAVAGLNPHAGEGGLFGREEIEAIAPAVAQARAEGIDAHGPYAPDTVFMRAREGAFDVVIAMYHDQGLIPVKYLGLAHGVNTTLGLPFVRTSPDHGTAFDLAGTGRADPSSLIAAIEAARQAQA
ncbi:4-hydroxythreonine-4-phosphate dehydrogenase PdxA [Aquabacterium sp. A08]|uniref:4-hydroxythreonine-4-phosphate dehydrogenase PdxA n=1 Tax=Aquabacterium sp. A08 TaxID=2718532 RepID=UPI001424262F|nr:4-hydroxythreonine-4-phosphate dehydrogenase PdxA [Aquabacterium sp. A08]NIC40152.1 4-hydroxythreonine-4-phosphate dehydrogenase PdxA [Aquabacterium sp. A08]